MKELPRSFVVVSGSMEPTIKTGSIAFTIPADTKTITKGDVIAFTSPSNPKDTILHRVNNIVSTSPLLFETKGDNNNAPDDWSVMAVGIKGKFVFSVPYLGYVGAFIKTPLGFGLIIGIPALLFIIIQILNIKKAIAEEVERKVTQALDSKNKSKQTKKIKPSKTSVKSVTLPIILFIALVSLSTIQAIKASFSDTVTVSGISLSVADFTKPSIPTNLKWSNPDVSCGGYTNSYTITPNWDDSFDSSGITKYQYEATFFKTGGNLVWPTFVYSSSYSGVFNQGEGVYSFRVRAYDADNNISPWSSDCSITYDKTLPSSIIVKPFNSDNDHDVTFPIIWYWDGKVEGTATDNLSGIDHVDISIYRQIADKYWSGSAWVNGTESTVRVTAKGTNNWSYQLDPLYIPFGKFKIVAHAVDKAGNVENSATIEFENQENAPADGMDPTIITSLSSGRHYYSFTVENISDFSTLSYSVIYDTDSAPKGFIGSVNLNNQSEYKNENILLGSESSGGGIAFDQNVNNIKITVILTRPDGTTLTLEKTDD